MEMVLGRVVRFTSIFGPSSTLLIKNVPESIRCVSCTVSTRWQLKPFERYSRCSTLSTNYLPILNRITSCRNSLGNLSINKNGTLLAHYCDAKQTPKTECEKPPEPEKKVSIFQKMKQLTKDYWHILIPVHLITSLGWIVIFYSAVKNGVDVIQILEYLNLSEKYLDMLRNSSAGNWALTYALYKIFTPLRYTITVGGTTMAIRRLNKLGLLKSSSFKRRPQGMNKTVESNKSAGEHKTDFKPERHPEPPKT